MLGEITENTKESYRANSYTQLGYALRDQLAAKLKAEWKSAKIDTRIAYGKIIGKAAWTDARWQAEAERILTGES